MNSTLTAAAAESDASILINCKGVSVSFPGAAGKSQRVLDGMDLAVHHGEILTLLGPSGCGKSTLLRTIAGLQAVDAGSIQLAQSARTLAPPSIGFVFQEATLLEWRTAWQNISLPLELTQPSLSASETQERIEGMLKAVALKPSDYHKYPDQLSGGMKMRVALARALVTAPTVILLDEPFAALDDVLRNQLNDLLLQLWSQQQITILFVTHNIAEAIYLSRRIGVMHQGKVQQVVEIPFEYPRERSLRSSEAFARCYGEISSLLEV